MEIDTLHLVLKLRIIQLHRVILIYCRNFCLYDTETPTIIYNPYLIKNQHNITFHMNTRMKLNEMKLKDDIEILSHIRCNATSNTCCVILCYAAIFLLREYCIQNGILYRQESERERENLY